ncbi:MAG TPA: hypothetical protein PK014_04110 [Thermoanaerobaculia bacterium]|nr:hypothetical protein [Thermoanaerobaculia bacterium]
MVQKVSRQIRLIIHQNRSSSGGKEGKNHGIVRQQRAGRGLHLPG